MILCSSEGWLLLRGWLLLQKKCLANTVEEGKKAASRSQPYQLLCRNKQNRNRKFWFLVRFPVLMNQNNIG